MKLILCVLAILMMSGCKAESNTDTITGTTFAGIKDYDGNYTVFRFTSDSQVEIASRYGSPNGQFIGDILMGDYTYNFPSIKIHLVHWNGVTVDLNGTFIDKDTFRSTITNSAKSSSGSEIYEYKRQ